MNYDFQLLRLIPHVAHKMNEFAQLWREREREGVRFEWRVQWSQRHDLIDQMEALWQRQAVKLSRDGRDTGSSACLLPGHSNLCLIPKHALFFLEVHERCKAFRTECLYERHGGAALSENIRQSTPLHRRERVSRARPLLEVYMLK